MKVSEEVDRVDNVNASPYTCYDTGALAITGEFRGIQNAEIVMKTWKG